jgi:RNA polymerase sigma factor (TIGR02999 family)
MSDVTRLIDAAAAGDKQAAADLLPLVYDELRTLAAVRMAGERTGHTLSPTALVHEAYLRLAPPAAQGANWNGRGHFFAAAAEAMRRILVESARRRKADKRGGDRLRLDLPDDLPGEDRPDDLVALDEALTRLEGHDPTAARLVQLRYFAGLSHQEAADALGLSRGAADRLWAVSRAWLFRQLSK